MSDNDFYALSRALKAAGRTALRNELNKGCQRAAKPLIGVAKAAAEDTFPKRGGLAAREAKIPFKAVTRTGSDPGVKIVAPGRYVVAKTTNATGQFRHPVYADASTSAGLKGKTKKFVKGQERKDWTWVTQDLGNAGWFDQAMVREAPAIRHELEKAIEAVATQIIRGVK